MRNRIFSLCVSLALCLSIAWASPAPRTITAFQPLSPREAVLRFPADEKPSLTDVLSLLPETLPVFLDYGNIPAAIPVDWLCMEGDYGNTGYHYYQFSPQWDETRYVSEGHLDIPYIGLFLADANAASLLSVTSSPNEQAVFDYLTNTMGLNAAAACGIMANIQAESYFNPHDLGDGGTSYGICQWHNERWTRLQTYCADNDYDDTTLDGQLHYLEYELGKFYSSVLSSLRAVTDDADGAYSAASVWCLKFEIPANKERVAVSRGNLARNSYWPEYGHVTISEYFDCDVDISVPERTVYLYENPITPSYTTALDNSVTVHSYRGARLSDNSAWYEVTVSYQDSDTALWVKAESDFVISARRDMVLTLKRDGNAVAAEIQCKDADATLCCVAYRDDGKMVDARLVPVTDAPSYNFTFDASPFDSVKAFLLDSEQRPLCQPETA